MDDVSEDLAILYRAVSRREGRVIYAGCITAREALRLVQLGVARLIDVRAEADADGAPREPEPLAGADSLTLLSSSSDSQARDFGQTLRAIAAQTENLLFISATSDRSHAAATLAARAGFCCVLNILDEREHYRQLHQAGDAAAAAASNPAAASARGCR